MTLNHQRDILEAAMAVANDLYAEHRGVGPWVEDADFRPRIVSELRARGFLTSELRALKTSVRSHPYDIIWERGGEKGASLRLSQ